MQLIKELFSNPTGLIVLCLILIIGLLIIAYYSKKISQGTKARIVDLQGFRLPLVLESALSWEFEENYLSAMAVNDSGVFGDDWERHIIKETEVSEG